MDLAQTQKEIENPFKKISKQWMRLLNQWYIKIKENSKNLLGLKEGMKSWSWKFVALEF